MRTKTLLPLILLCACKCGEEIVAVPDSGTGPGTDTGLPPDPDTVAIEIEPSQVELTIDGVTRESQVFRVEAIDEKGARTDVTGQAGFMLADDEVGTLSGATFTSRLVGGRTTLSAFVGTFTATASIRVILKREVTVPIGDPLPQDPGTVVGNAPEDPGRAPSLVYPNDGVMLPKNLGSIEVHYRPGPSNTLFRIAFTSPNAEVMVYTRCEPLADGCLYAPAADVWQSIADTNSGTDPVTVTVTGTDDTGTGKGSSDSIQLRFSAVRVDGGLYYWTTDGGRIIRVDFGAAQQPEQFYPFEDTGTCYGCHSISKNGRHMTLSRSGQWDGRLTIIEIGAQAILLQDQDDKREQFQSWDPTSMMFAGVWSDGAEPDTSIRIRDGQTGDVLEAIGVGVEPDHPDWSPRGDRILFTVVTRHQTSQRPGRGGISYVQELPGGGWGSPVELIAPQDGFNRYYPAYAPDAAFFLYCESVCPQGEIYTNTCDADADPSAKLYAMQSEGGTPIYLAKADGPGVEDGGQVDLSNTFPKWAPFVDPQRRDGSGRLMWFTFSSRRQYGLRSPNGSDQWLWMAAIDPDAIQNGDDGSFPAFALPFQDLGTSNHIAQWTAAIVPPNPGTDGGVDPLSDGGACIALGDVCVPGTDTCCGAATCSENGPGIYLCRPNI
jgi:hypothetical protein